MDISPRALIIVSGTVISAASVGILTLQQSPAMILRANYEQAVNIAATPAPDSKPVTQLTEVHSPDGTMKFIMKRERTPDARISYSFRTFDSQGGNHLIYEATVPVGEDMQIPPNSWSPDNKYVFITSRGSFAYTAKVFLADGSPVAEGQQYIDVSGLFREKLPDLSLRDITGWDDPGLLHVFTYTSDNAKGPSYWFELYDRAFIELANR